MLYQTENEASDAYRNSPSGFFAQYHRRHFNERELISPDWTWYETKYHYNLVENGIIDLLRDHAPRMTGNAVLDVGAGTGHWIDFYRDVLESRSIVGVDFSEVAAEKLRKRYAGNADIRIVHSDITLREPDFLGRFDVVNAIGVMFHIIDDAKWLESIRNTCAYLTDRGVALIGGDFGDRTEQLGVMREVRSLSTWDEALRRAGARRVGLKRFDWFKGGCNPGLKNNLLAFVRT